MNVPGIPFVVRVPVAHNDRPPEGLESEIFTFAPATEVSEQFVGIDLVQARKVYSRMLDAFNVYGSLPLLP